MGTNASYPVTLGDADGSGSDIEIFEVRVYNNALSASDLQDIEKYLTLKWLSPASSSGLTIWYDLSDAGTITSSATKVSQVADKSGNSRHLTQANSSAQPTWSSGNLSLNFNGSSQCMSTSSWPLNSAATTIFTVKKANSLTAPVAFWERSSMFWQTKMGIINDFDNLSGANATQGVGLIDGGYTLSLKYVAATLNKTIDTMVISDNASDILRKSSWNGVDGTYYSGYGSTTIGATNYPLYIGARTCNTLYANFNLHELIIYNRTLSDFERRWMEAYLAYKWSITPW